MKLFVTSDWHGDWVTDGFERIDDLECATIPLLTEIAECDEDCGFLFCGDLADPFSRNTHLAVAFALQVATTLNKWSVPNWWVVGNHDIIEDQRGCHTLMALRHAGEFTRVADTPGMLEGLRVFCLPYTSPIHTYDPEHVVSENAGESPLIVAGHLMLEGIEPGSETTDMARGRDVFWPFEAIEKCFPNAVKINGHYHREQTYRGVHIPGSLLRLTHSEEGNKPVYLVHDIDL